MKTIHILAAIVFSMSLFCQAFEFHALLIKKKGKWKILMDYDSSEGGNVGENDFNNAHAMEDIKSFAR
jgi:hypothetical protein